MAVASLSSVATALGKAPVPTTQRLPPIPLPPLSRSGTGGRRRARPRCRMSSSFRAEIVAGNGSGSGGGEIASSPEPSVRIVAVVGGGSLSPIKNTPWYQVMLHTASRLKWVDEGFEMPVFTDESIKSNDSNLEVLQKELAHSDMLVSVAVDDEKSITWLQKNGLGNSKRSLEVVKTVSDAWERHNSDDIRFCLLVIINSYIKPVPILKNLRAKGLSTLSCMLKNCRTEVLNCLFDPNCRKALQCLNSCSPTDQVCNYRCIASYESPYLEAFSLCVLQKYNCLELDAEIPSKPAMTPLSTFRGEALNHEIAEDLFVGWLGSLEWSWRVVAGQNPAYDQFPCQYQLFYRGKARGSFWYEPVFQVRTLEDKLVWRRRRYRVRRANVPGTFYFSVLDNGVVSKEFWTIVDVGDDFSWGLFHYSGAAAAAGQSYTGAVLVSPDGMYPPETERHKLNSALDKCSIKDWELYTVDNCSCKGAPLGIPEGSCLHSKVRARDERWASKTRRHMKGLC